MATTLAQGPEQKKNKTTVKGFETGAQERYEGAMEDAPKGRDFR
jgi:hypothetical protein